MGTNCIREETVIETIVKRIGEQIGYYDGLPFDDRGEKFGNKALIVGSNGVNIDWLIGLRV